MCNMGERQSERSFFNRRLGWIPINNTPTAATEGRSTPHFQQAGRFVIGLLLIACCLFPPTPASAQNAEPSAILYTPQTDLFPLMKVYLDTQNAQGDFIHGLQPSNITLLENGQPVAVQDLREERVGVQLVMVINPGDTFLQRDTQGNTQYDQILVSLVEWARRRLGSTVDDLSILVTDGPRQTHLSNALELLYTLSSYYLPANPVPSLDSLYQAVEIAAETPPRQGMEKAVLFITSPLSGDQTINIQNLIARAKQDRVRIYIWLVAPSSLLNSQSAYDLIELSNQTMGKLTTISTPLNIPSPETILEPLRDVYTLTYQSQIRNGGDQQMQAEIIFGEQSIKTPTLAFQLNLTAPDLAFISPPAEITRKVQEAAPQENTETTRSKALQPEELPLSLLIDFPDGRSRSIVLTRFIVDGNVIEEKTTPPFDRVVWDLRSYERSGQHIIQAEVTDQFGLSAKTIETPIYIKVNRPIQSPLTFLNQNLPIIAIITVVFSAAILVLVLVMGGRLHPASLRLSQRLNTQRKARNDPLTQPIPIAPLPPPASPPKRPAPLPAKPTQPTPTVFAYLSRLSESPNDDTVVPFPMVTEELTIGRNPGRVLLVVDDASVEALHARLVRNEDGRFRIYDAGTMTGTWVNYTPVSKEGVNLEQGDLIHFGRVGFRFIIKDKPAAVSKFNEGTS